MGLRIATNVNSLVAQRHVSNSTAKLAKHSQRLSSGFRINQAADDAAGLAISEKMTATSRSLVQAKRNAADGVSLIQTAEGGLNEITNIIARLRELSVQSASDTLGNVERGFLQKEFVSLRDEIDRIVESTDFNGTKLLMGDVEVPEVLFASHNRSPLEVQVGRDYHPSIDGLDVPRPTNVIRIDLRDINSRTWGEGGLGIRDAEPETDVGVDSKAKAQHSIARLDAALEKVNSYRANLGAVQNRLGSTINNLAIQIEGVNAARSRIRDADFAEESAGLTQAGILQQAGVSVLAQANNLPQLALKLLQT